MFKKGFKFGAGYVCGSVLMVAALDVVVKLIEKKVKQHKEFDVSDITYEVPADEFKKGLDAFVRDLEKFNKD